jgi:TPR repeat protein
MANRNELAVIRGARAGHAPAQLALGKLYLFGSTGLPQSRATALHWLDRAARQDTQEAWILIGSHIAFEDALQTAQPMQLCLWYERAFDAGVMQAGLVLAKLVLGQAEAAVAADLKEKALSALKVAARAGLPDAQWLLAQTKRIDGGAVPQGGPSGADGGTDLFAVDASAWVERAADGGVIEAQHVLAEDAWVKLDVEAFLHRALPLARALVRRADAAPRNGSAGAPRLGANDVVVLSRCARVLSDTSPNGSNAQQKLVASDEIQRFLELATQQDDREAQLALGLWFARMGVDGERVAFHLGSANFKKAIRWLTMAGEQGLAAAWYALSRIYLKSEFSQRSVADAQLYLDRAAHLGYGAAQWECGNSAWRMRREDETQDVRAVYWLQMAAAQGIAEAHALLDKIAPPPVAAPWVEAARQALTRDKVNSYPFLAARIDLAALFGLSRAEALLLDVNAVDQGHCMVVDIRAHYGRSKRRLILLRTAQERQALDRVARLFVDVDCGPSGPEGNYRQRLYRLKTLLPGLDETREDGGEDGGDEGGANPAA